MCGSEEDELLRKDMTKESLDMRERRRKEEDVVIIWRIVGYGCAHV